LGRPFGKLRAGYPATAKRVGRGFQFTIGGLGFRIEGRFNAIVGRQEADEMPWLAIAGNCG